VCNEIQKVTHPQKRTDNDIKKGNFRFKAQATQEVGKKETQDVEYNDLETFFRWAIMDNLDNMKMSWFYDYYWGLKKVRNRLSIYENHETRSVSFVFSRNSCEMRITGESPDWGDTILKFISNMIDNKKSHNIGRRWFYASLIAILVASLTFAILWFFVLDVETDMETVGSAVTLVVSASLLLMLFLYEALRKAFPHTVVTLNSYKAPIWVKVLNFILGSLLLSIFATVLLEILGFG